MSKEENKGNIPFCEFIESHINQSKIKQTDIAEGLNYDKPNVITMFKQGKTKVPLHKVPTLAVILGLDPTMLFRMALTEYDPRLMKTIDGLEGMILVTKNEAKIIERIRNNVSDSSLKVDTNEKEEAFSAFLNMLD